MSTGGLYAFADYASVSAAAYTLPEGWLASAVGFEYTMYLQPLINASLLSAEPFSKNDGEWFIARLLPYRTLDDRIEGAVLTLIDITARRRAEDVARASEERLKFAALTTNDYAIIVQDLDGVMMSWNRGAQSVFGYEEAEARTRRSSSS